MFFGPSKLIYTSALPKSWKSLFCLYLFDSQVFVSGPFNEPCEDNLDSYAKVELTFPEVVKIREIEAKAELLNLQLGNERLFEEIRKQMVCM